MKSTCGGSSLDFKTEKDEKFFNSNLTRRKLFK